MRSAEDGLRLEDRLVDLYYVPSGQVMRHALQVGQLIQGYPVLLLRTLDEPLNGIAVPLVSEVIRKGMRRDVVDAAAGRKRGIRRGTLEFIPTARANFASGGPFLPGRPPRHVFQSLRELLADRA